MVSGWVLGLYLVNVAEYGAMGLVYFTKQAYVCPTLSQTKQNKDERTRPIGVLEKKNAFRKSFGKK